jgi:hypothetical protein
MDGAGKRSDGPIQIVVPEDSAPRAEDVPPVDSVARNRR